MIIHRKNVTEQLKQALLKETSNLNSDNSTHISNLDLALQLIVAQHETIKKLSGKIKNYRQNLSGLQKAYDMVLLQYGNVVKDNRRVEEEFSDQIRRTVDAKIKAEGLEKTLKEVLGLESVKKRIFANAALKEALKCIE